MAKIWRKAIEQELPKYHWTPEKYIKLVENTNDPILQEYMKTEIDYIIKNINDPSSKTFIEVGGGYGRVVPQLAKLARNVIAVEIDKKMAKELQKRAGKCQNVIIIEGDAAQLTILLKRYDDIIEKPVLLLLQNTLGTIIGDPYKILAEMKQLAMKKNSEIILSLFCQESLKSWGIKMYAKLQSMVGKIDTQKTDLNRSVFISKTGYKSKWWATTERIDLEKNSMEKFQYYQKCLIFI